jgi:hypothetical protein
MELCFSSRFTEQRRESFEWQYTLCGMRFRIILFRFLRRLPNLRVPSKRKMAVPINGNKIMSSTQEIFAESVFFLPSRMIAIMTIFKINSKKNSVTGMEK